MYQALEILNVAATRKNFKMIQQMTFLDLFSGIGGFRFGMEAAGHKCVGFCEIDKFARRSYKAIFNTEEEVEMHDITTVSDEFIRGIGSVDIICGGFPCQAFSIAGRRKGFEDTRGTLFFEIARFASILKPRYLFLENVKGLLNHEGGDTFETILETLDELGYDCTWQVLNSKEYVPQNRERLYIVGSLRGACTRTVFPVTRQSGSVDPKSKKINYAGTTNKNNDSAISIRERTYYTDGILPTLTATDYKGPKQIVIGNVNPSGRGMNGFVFDSNGLSPTLTTNKGEGSKIAIPVLTPDRLNKRQNGRRFKNNNEEMFTLTAQDRHGIVVAGQLSGKYRQAREVFCSNGISPTLTTMQGGQQEPKILVREGTKLGYAEAGVGDSINLAYPQSKTRRGRVGKGIAHTLVTSGQQGTLEPTIRIRKLTPLECWRLQGFPDWAFLAAKFESKETAHEILINNLNHYDCKYEQKISNSQLYKQAGNSVTTHVIFEIATRL